MKSQTLSLAEKEWQSDLSGKPTWRISIIVPVLDEDARILSFVQHLRARAGSAEIIVVYAATSQGLSQSVIDSCDRVLSARRGRAAQMNAGAKAAAGDIFWFVHADCEVPHGCLDQIARTLEEPQTVGGCFQIRFPRSRLIYRVSDVCGNLAVELFGRCYGDHGIFCRREEFMAINGYPDVPLLEDAEFYRLLRRRGRTRQLGDHIVTSPRRYEEIGAYRLTAFYLLLSALYVLRFPIPFLARIYDRFCLRRNEHSRLPRPRTDE
jgi:rSAM/selenodomain-associated transferase 2